MELPARADVVVIGGGVIGASAAWHLAARGGDVVLLEAASVGAGTTSHAAANMETYREDPVLHDMIVDALATFPALEAESGQAIGWRASGRVTYTADAARFAAMRAVPARTRARGIETTLISPAEIAAKLPVIEQAGLAGGLWVPSDGRLDPTGLATAFARAARRRGARILERTRVKAIGARDGRVSGVETEIGAIACDAVVLAAGLWSSAIAASCGLRLPLMALQHFYMLTRPIAGLPRDLPLFLSYDERTYGREDVGGLLVGVFDADAIPVEPDALPRDFAFALLPENWDQIAPNLPVVMNRFPALRRAEIRALVNGPESFTPDGRMLLGPAPGIAGLFLACGMNSNGIALATGAGRAIAEIVATGRAALDVARFDPRRFAPFQGDRLWLRSRIPHLPAAMCGAVDEAGEIAGGRFVRCSPLHARHAAAGAVFVSAAGADSPAWFAPDGAARGACVAREVEAAERGVGMIDRSAAATFRLEGPGAAAALARLCGDRRVLGADAALPAPMLGPHGGVEAMPLALRVGPDSWLLVAEPEHGAALADWVRGHGGPGSTLTDLAEGFVALEFVGPRAAALVARLAGAALPEPGRVAALALAGAPARVAGLPQGFLALVAADKTETIARGGEGLGVASIGALAAETLRVRAGLKRFGREASPAIDAVASGIAPSLDGADFIGRAALAALAPRRHIAAFRVRRAAACDLTHEPLTRDGRFAGYVTSSALVPEDGLVAFFARVDADAPLAALRLVVDGAEAALLPGPGGDRLGS